MKIQKEWPSLFSESSVFCMCSISVISLTRLDTMRNSFSFCNQNSLCFLPWAMYLKEIINLKSTCDRDCTEKEQ